MRPPAQSCPEATIRRPPAPLAGWGLRKKKAGSALQGCRGCGCRPGPPGAPSPSWALSPACPQARSATATYRQAHGAGLGAGTPVSSCPRGWDWVGAGELSTSPSPSRVLVPGRLLAL